MLEKLSRHEPQARAVLRIVTSLLLIEHGTQKFFNFPPSQMEMDLGGLMLLAAILETFGGLLVLIGLFSRPVAFILSGFMAVAYFMAHSSPFFSPMLSGGEAAYLFAFLFLYLAAAGPGPWSVDAARSSAGTVAPPDYR